MSSSGRMKKHPLRLLMAADPAADASSAMEALHRYGYEVEVTRVATPDDFRAALATEEYEMVVCDRTMRDLDASTTLEIFRESGKDVPMLFTAGMPGGLHKKGGKGVMAGDPLIRLGAMMLGEFHKARLRRRKRQPPALPAASQPCAGETLLRIASKVAHIGGWIIDFAIPQISWSDEVCAIHEVPAGTSPGYDEALDYYAPESRERLSRAIEHCLFDGAPFDEEMQIITASGRWIWVRTIGEGIRDAQGSITRIQGALQDITEQKLAIAEAERLAQRVSRGQLLAEETTRVAGVRYLAQRDALIALISTAPPESVDILVALRPITETTARTLQVGRVSIWRETKDRCGLECLDLYELESGSHSAGAMIAAYKYPTYFRGFAEMELIAADDAITNPWTSDFAENYLKPLGITSMLDVPIHFENQPDYLLCNEHVGPARQWTADEKTFAIAIGNLVSLALASTERFRAQQEMERSHQRFLSVATATNDTIWDWNLETDAFWWNDGYANLFGWVADEFQVTIRAWIRQIHPEDRSRVVQGIYTAIERGDSQWSDEYRFISNNGSVADVLDRGQVIRGSSGKPIRMVGGITDMTANKNAERELSRSHRALKMLSSCNEMVIRTSVEEELLGEACRIAVEIGGYRMAWVGYAMENERRDIIPMAHAGEEHGYLSEVQISWADDRSSGIGPGGQAVRSGKMVVVGDIVGNPIFSRWLLPARERGYRSVVSLPLRDETRVFGVLCLYSAEPHPSAADELKLLQEMANDLAFGIGNIRSRKARQRTQEVVIKVAQAVSSGIGSEFFDLLTRNMVEALGGDGGLIGRYDPVGNSIETISFVRGGELLPNIRYGLEGTPCEQIVSGEACIFEQGVGELFPDDHMLVGLGIEAYAGIPLFHQTDGVAGIMVVFFANPLKETALVQSTLQIFAARAASELDRQQADARIREQASLLDKAQDAILVRDLDHIVTFWNKGAERLYGWTAAEAVGRSVEDLIYRDTSNFAKAYVQTLENGEWVGEMGQIDKEGHNLTIEGRWTLVRDDKGKPASVFVINTDISEQRKLQQQFLRAQRLESIGTLAGGIAHDLNNILAPITLSIELLRMRVTDSRSSELLATIAESAKRGSDMVGQVLSYARGMEGRRVEVHPRQLIREIEGILRGTFLKNTTVEISVCRDLWTLHGDPTQLHQILLNLCVNARDALTDGGKLTIGAENVEIDPAFTATNLDAKEGPHVCIRVQDTGEGIAPEIIDKIFDPFFTTKSVGKGTGLGLSTSLAIVKSHGGFICVTSTLGVGTCFRVYLPAIPEPACSVAPQSQAVLPEGSGELILIVDDEPSIRLITRHTLETFGYRALIASNGQEALEIFARHRAEIRCVITDMMMPTLDGPATIARLMEIAPSVRIIATSGIPANREIAHLAGSGVKDFLAKPYTAETLLKCLQRVLALGPFDDSPIIV